MNEAVRRAVVALTTSYPLRRTDWAGIFIQRLYAGFEHTGVIVVCPAVDRAPEPSEVPHVQVVAARYAPTAWQTLAQRSGGVAPGLKKHPWRIAMLPGLLLSMATQVWRAARQGDLIHANWAVCGAIAAPVAAVRGLPLVTTLRGDDVKRAGVSRIDRWLLEVACRRSRVIVCVSDAMAASLKAMLPGIEAKVHVVRNGVDDVFLAVPREARAENAPVRIGAIGSLIPRKGFDVLLRAIHHMRHVPAELTIVGAGPEKNALMAQVVALGVEERVTFAGELPPADVPEFLASLDIFVLSSRSEGRPNVVIEALAAGLPVVSTDLPGVAGLIGDTTGWRVPTDDAVALGAALDDACSDTDRLARMGASARNLMLADGGWRRAAAEYEALFAHAIATHEETR